MNVLREKQIPRRTFLRGCGAALALPLLDVMQASGAKSVQPPKRVGGGRSFTHPTAWRKQRGTRLRPATTSP